jgi:hypothetical protein
VRGPRRWSARRSGRGCSVHRVVVP